MFKVGDYLKITVLDAKTLGDDISLDIFKQFGEVKIYQQTSICEVAERIENTDVVVVNKIKLNGSNLGKNVKLICVTATGYDNIDVDYCKNNGIAVCNVKGYSTDSVAQVTVAMVLTLVNKLNIYNASVKNLSYTKGGVANILVPVYHELSSMVWGVIGYGNIGKKVADVAKAFGCKLMVYKKHPDNEYCVSLEKLLTESDIITIHTPLNDETYHLINKDNIKLLKKNCILVNVARGAVTDEDAIAQAVKCGDIGGFATDVYTAEPIQENNPLIEIINYDNVILTPHMAWSAFEARQRCINEIVKNIECFINGKINNRIDI